jgi:galactokinase/galacturonokinase
MTHADKYAQIYKQEPQGIAFCPYRICPLGAHSDHQYGKVTGLALNKGIHIAYGAKQNGVIELFSLNFTKRAQFHVSQPPKERQNDWADYLRGAAIALGKRHPLHVGLCGVIAGSLPIGGLSSSAAVIIAFLSALCRVNGITLTQHEMIAAMLDAENNYVGVSCGKLDPSCEIFAKKDHLLYLDTKDESYELIPRQKNMKPYEIAILFSGIERTLVGSLFNKRVDECKSAAYALFAFEGMEYGKFEDARLRLVPHDVYERHANKLPEPWRKRARHWYTEFARVEKGADAWRQGDMDTFGRLTYESGKSSIVNFETGSPELINIYESMLATEGIYGGRFSGAGFRGCCMALVDPSYKESISNSIKERYRKDFPALSDKFSIEYCQSGDGADIS